MSIRCFATMLHVALAGDVTHPPRYQTQEIMARIKRRRRSAGEIYLGLGYWLRRRLGDRILAVCRCEVWDQETKSYQFATWADAFRVTDDPEASVFEYRGQKYRLMVNTEPGYPKRWEDAAHERGAGEGKREGGNGGGGVGACTDWADDASECGAGDSGVVVRPTEPGVPVHAGCLRPAGEHEVRTLVRHADGWDVHRRFGDPVGEAERAERHLREPAVLAGAVAAVAGEGAPGTSERGDGGAADSGGSLDEVLAALGPRGGDPGPQEEGLVCGSGRQVSERGGGDATDGPGPALVRDAGRAETGGEGWAQTHANSRSCS